MEILLSRFLKNSNVCYIRVGDCFLKIEAIKVKIKGFEDFEFFAHKTKIGKLDFWNITEAISGVRILKPHPKFLVLKNNVEDALTKLGKISFEKNINKKIDDLYLSPSFRTVANPNRIQYVATKKNNNKRVDDPSRYRIPFHKK